MKAVLAVLFCVSAIALGQECGQAIQDYNSCLSTAASSGRPTTTPGMPTSLLQKQISDCFTKSSCQDPLAKAPEVSESGDSETDADAETLNSALATCMEKIHNEDEKMMMEECIATTAKLPDYHFTESPQEGNGNEGANMLLSVVSAVYNEDICTNDAARSTVASCLEKLGEKVFPPADEQDCKKTQLGHALAFEKKQWKFTQDQDHCYNNVSKDCRRVVDELPKTTCDCATKLFKDLPEDLAKKYEECVNTELGKDVADRMGAQLKEAITEAQKSIGTSFCPSQGGFEDEGGMSTGGADNNA